MLGCYFRGCGIGITPDDYGYFLNYYFSISLENQYLYEAKYKISVSFSMTTTNY